MMDSKLAKFDFLSPNLSRLDKNMMTSSGLRDLEMQFGEYTHLVLSLLLFFGNRYRHNLFNICTFTLTEFAESCGLDRSNLQHIITPPNGRYPSLNGHTFKTRLDYALYLMVARNWVLSRPVYDSIKGNNERIIKIDGIQLLKDIQLNLDKRSNEVKTYTIRFSEEMILAINRQYWTVDIADQKQLRASNNRNIHIQSLHINLSAKKQLFLSRKQEENITASIDELSNAALINMNQRPADRKKAIKKMLDKIVEKTTNLNLKYEFFSKTKYAEDYYVRMSFTGSLLEKPDESSFLYILYNELLRIFEGKYPEHVQDKTIINGEKEPFQRWMTNLTVDINIKIKTVLVAYKQVFGSKLLPTEQECYEFIQNGAS
ncbi:hypothetical protein EON73_02540, partial [bacterium]